MSVTGLHFYLEKYPDIYNKYLDYVLNVTKNYPNAHLFCFYEIYNNVLEGLENRDSVNETEFYSLINSVLDAMVYTSSNKVKDMIQRAEEDKIKRFHNMTKEQQETVTKWSLNIK